MLGIERFDPYSLLDRLKLAKPLSYPSKVNADPSSLLSQIIEEMHAYEKAKYPSPPYDYQRVEIDLGGNRVTAIYTKYDGARLTEAQLADIEINAAKLRQLSLLAGVTNALLFSDHYLEVDRIKKANLFSIINQFVKKIKSKKSRTSDDMNIFVDELIRAIQLETGQPYQSILRKVRLAERYFIADYQPAIFVNETNEHGEVTTQLDVLLKNPLTQAQKKEFVKIHADHKPGWFLRLPRWERDWLLQRVLKLLADTPKWQAFASLYQSSAMSHIPGIQNIRRSVLIKKGRIISDSVKSGTHVPYEMPKSDCELQTNENADQVLSIMSSLAEENMNRMWPNIAIKPLLYVQSILSDTFAGGQDNRLANSQRNAVIAKSYLHSDSIVEAGNDPVNLLRIFAAESGFFSKNFSGRWKHTLRILQYAAKFIALAEDGVLTKEQANKLKQIKMFKAELELMHRNAQFTGLTRNFNAYKVVFTRLLVESMGGMVSTNCKSGKDRTGYDDLYGQAILIYLERYGVLPRYDEQGDNRRQFIEIFRRLFDARKLQALAANNTPGSFGLKDSARMLCRDIAEALGKSYQQSNALADMNKPSILKRDELKEAKELNAFSHPTEALIVKEVVARGNETNLLTKVERIKQACSGWRATEHYQTSKNKLASVVFSKKISPDVKVGFELLKNQIVTRDTEPLAYEAVIKSFFAVHPLNKRALLTAANLEIAEKIYQICKNMGAVNCRIKLLSGEDYCPAVAAMPFKSSLK